MHGRVVYPDGDLTRSRTLSPLRPPSPPPRPPAPPSAVPRSGEGPYSASLRSADGLGPSASYRLEMERACSGKAPAETTKTAIRMVQVDLSPFPRGVPHSSYSQPRGGLGEYCDVPLAGTAVRTVDAPRAAASPQNLQNSSVFSQMMAREGRVLRPVVLSTTKGAAVITHKQLSDAGMVRFGDKENARNGVWGGLAPPPRRDFGQMRVFGAHAM